MRAELEGSGDKRVLCKERQDMEYEDSRANKVLDVLEAEDFRMRYEEL